nr:LysR family transcriptional regulator [Nitrincola nitratireducens]
MIERTHLRILRELERRGSVTAAADALNLTQSALSHTVKKLESMIGGPLWVKDGRGVRLTQAGHYLLKEAKRVLPQLERIDETLLQFAQHEQGSLNIGMECHPCYQWLLKVVSPFLSQFPNVDLDVKQSFQFGGMAALFNHDIDLLVTPDPLHRPGVTFEPVFSYELVLVVGATHPLHDLNHVEPHALVNEVLLTYPVDVDRLDIFQQFLLPANCRPKKHKTLEATEILLQMVASNRGVTALPRWLVEQTANTLPIRPLRLGQEGIYKHIHLGRRDDDRDSPLVQSFFDIAKSITF